MPHVNHLIVYWVKLNQNYNGEEPDPSRIILHPSNRHNYFIISANCFISKHKPHKVKIIRAYINGVHNGSPEPPKTTRRGRKKSTTGVSESTNKKPRRSRKSEDERANIESNDPVEIEHEFEEFDDGIDFPYEDPSLVCCFGPARKEFVPTVRVSDEQMHPDMYSEWKMLQWNPPEFVRAPGGPPSNVAISHVRLEGSAAFMGKIGGDKFGQGMLYMMNKEKVQTRAV